MSDEQQLLQAIYDDPDNDTARLVFADWLEENGDQHWAEFIRVECDLANRDNDELSLEKIELDRRRQNLVGKIRKAWNLGKQKFGTKIFYHRGFIKAEGRPDNLLSKTAKGWWKEHRKRVDQLVLLVKKLETGDSQRFPKDMRARLTELRRNGRAVCRQEELEEIARFPNLRFLQYHNEDMRCKTGFVPLGTLQHVHTLRLYGPAMDKATTETLQVLPQVRRLYLHKASQESLEGLRHLANLEDLELGGLNGTDAPMDLDALEALKRLRRVEVHYRSNSSIQNFPKLPELRELRWWIDPNHQVEFAHVPKLEKLSLGYRRNRGKKRSLECLSSLKKLRELHLDGDWLFEGAEGLLECPDLKTLHFEFENIPAKQLKHLPQLPGVTVLTLGQSELYFFGSTYKPKMVSTIIDRFPNLEAFHVRDFYSCDYFDDLLRLEKLRQLTIGIGYNEDQAMWNKRADLPQVEILTLLGAYAEEHVVEVVSRFPGLKVLNLPRASIGAAARKKLKQFRPELIILT